VPWAIAPMALVLAAYWMVVSGRWVVATDSAQQRARLRANPLSWSMWCASMSAGFLGFGAMFALLLFIARLVVLPDGAPITTPPGMPFITGFALLTMQSLVAAVTEEAAFRGYMQSMVARQHGVVLAILAQGTLFGLLHAPNHPGVVLLMLPYYVAVSAVYGGLTWAADSILPALVLHAVGDVVVLTRWWLTSRPEWQLGAAAPALVWQSGVDGAFIAAALASAALTVATTWSYFWVRRLRLTGPSG
jgi:membrane protease YdiL (CAAX protease family)